MSLGKSRADFQKAFNRPFPRGKDIKKSQEENYVAQQPGTGAYVQLVGTSKEINSALCCVPIPGSNKVVLAASISWLKTFIWTVAPAWADEGVRWVASNAVAAARQGSIKKEVGSLTFTLNGKGVQDGALLTLLVEGK